MIGQTKLVLNKVTLLQAIQLWLDAEFKKAPKATDVQFIGSDTTYSVTLMGSTPSPGASTAAARQQDDERHAQQTER